MKQTASKAVACWFLSCNTRIQSWRWRWYIPPKLWLTLRELHGVSSQKKELIFSLFFPSPPSFFLSSSLNIFSSNFLSNFYFFLSISCCFTTQLTYSPSIPFPPSFLLRLSFSRNLCSQLGWPAQPPLWFPALTAWFMSPDVPQPLSINSHITRNLFSDAVLLRLKLLRKYRV
jgi:hypothetical protein